MTDDDFDKVGVDDDFADEFDFVEEGHDNAKPSATQHSSASGQKSGSSFPIGKLIVVTIVLAGGFYGYKYFLTHKRQPAPVTEAQPAPVEAPPIAAAPTDDQLAEAVPEKSFEQVQQDLKPAAPQIPDEINATLDSISQEMTLNVNQIKQLESTISNLTDTVDQLNKSISAMDNRVLSLTETVDGLAQDLTNVKKIMADDDIDLTSFSTIKLTDSSAPPPKASDNGPMYTVHAIIPGRAWLKSNKGQILTVTEGDKIGDYGTVAQIDAANGLVRTSSGITFR